MSVATYYTRFLPQILGAADDMALPHRLHAKITRAEDTKPNHVLHRQEMNRDLHLFTEPVSSDAYTFTAMSKLGVMGRAFNDTASFFNRLPGLQYFAWGSTFFCYSLFCLAMAPVTTAMCWV